MAAQFGWLWGIVARETHLLLLPAIFGGVALVKRRSWPFLLFGPVFSTGMAILFNHPSYTIAAQTGTPKLLPLVIWITLLAAAGAAALRRSLALPILVAVRRSPRLRVGASPHRRVSARESSFAVRRLS